MEDVKLEEQKEETLTPEVKEEKIEETYKEMSPFKLILRRFFRSRLSVVGLVMLVFLFAFSFLGPLVYSKWGETEVDRTKVITIVEVEHTYINEYGEEIVVIQELEIETDNLKAKPSWDTRFPSQDIFISTKLPSLLQKLWQRYWSLRKSLTEV